MGILHLHNVLKKVLVPRRPLDTPAQDIMVRRLHAVGPEVSHTDAVGVLQRKKTHCLVVVGPAGVCLGVATSYDIARADAELLRVSVQRASIYSLPDAPYHDPDYGSTDPEDMFRETIKKVKRDYGLLHQGSASDLSDACSDASRATAQRHGENMLVMHFMRPADQVTTCRPSTPVAELAALLSKTRVRAAVVVDAERPVGIVTTNHLVAQCVLDPALWDAAADRVMRDPVAVQETFSRNQAASPLPLLHP